MLSTAFEVAIGELKLIPVFESEGNIILIYNMQCKYTEHVSSRWKFQLWMSELAP